GPRREGSDLTLVLLAQLVSRLGLARRDARTLLLPDPLLDRFVLPPRDLLAAERASLAAFHRPHSCPVAAAAAWRSYHSRIRARWRRRRADPGRRGSAPPGPRPGPPPPARNLTPATRPPPPPR